MRPISLAGFQKPTRVDAGAVPMLQWLKIEDLVVDPSYQRPIAGSGRRNVERITNAFCWCCFRPVIVSPVQGGKFAIIDGQHRSTAAALAGFESVPCQIVVAAREEQAAAFKAINCVTTPISRVAVHAAALVAGEPWAVRVADVCVRADVELLRYPVPINKQGPGQTMAVGAINQCLRKYGEETVITALQCVTQTSNNLVGLLKARMIKALCNVISRHYEWCEGGLALLDAFDQINLSAIQAQLPAEQSGLDANPVESMADVIAAQLAVLLPVDVAGPRAPGYLCKPLGPRPGAVCAAAAERLHAPI